MYEMYTYESLLADVLANAPAGIDTRQGSIFFDAVSGVLLKIAKLYADLDYIAQLVYIDSTTGEYLDRKASEYSITRLSATKCCYHVTFEGTTPAIGERFFTDGMYFVLKKTEDGEYYLEAEIAGTGANGVYSGTAAIPVNNISGLISATFGALMELGSDEETDEDLRTRIREKLSGPAENGNKQHYRTWCEEVEGVGRARIIPLWKGPNTVKGIIIDPSGTPAAAAVIERVQEKIDPDADGDGEGDGLGEGVANLGAHFTAVAPSELKIAVSFNAELASGATTQQVIDEATAAITKYLKELTLDTPEDSAIIVRISEVGAILNGLSSIVDYNELKFNGASKNIEPNFEEVAVLGGIALNVL